jgi:uncharacterized protein YaaN involved in tellurite resistance
MSTDSSFLVSVVDRAPKSSLPLAALDTSALEEATQRVKAQLAEAPSKLLGSWQASSAGTMGEDLNQLARLARKLDPAAMSQRKGFFVALLGRAKDLKAKLEAQYASVDQQLNTVVSQLDVRVLQYQQQLQDLAHLRESQRAYIKSLEDLIQQWRGAAEKLSQWISQQPSAQTLEAASELAEVTRGRDRALKRVDDLERGRQLALQMDARIDVNRENVRGLIETFEDIKATTIPAWRGVFMDYLQQLEIKSGVELASSISATTEAALRRSAELMHQNTLEVAEARQRPIVTLETLQYTQGKFLQALTDIQRIEAEGQARRVMEAPEVRKLEQDLRDSLSSPSLKNAN